MQLEQTKVRRPAPQTQLCWCLQKSETQNPEQLLSWPTHECVSVYFLSTLWQWDLPTLPFLLHRLVCRSLHGSNLCLMSSDSSSKQYKSVHHWNRRTDRDCTQELDSALQHSAFTRPHGITQLCGKQGFSSSHQDLEVSLYISGA